MVTKFAGAQFRSLGVQKQPLMSAHDVIVIHTMGITFDQTDAGFKQKGYIGLEAHFGTRQNGELVQWQDLDHTADAVVEGNSRCISIENEDTGGRFPKWKGSDVPAFTTDQLSTLVTLCAFLCDKFDIPATAIPDSLPSRRGIGWHRLGVTSKPAHQPGYRIEGGELWSKSVGKVCPGDRRIAQIQKVIIPNVQATLAGKPLPVPLVKDDTMKIIKMKGTSHCYLGNGIQRKHLNGKDDLDVARALLTEAGQSTKVLVVPKAELDFYGILVGPDF